MSSTKKIYRCPDCGGLCQKIIWPKEDEGKYLCMHAMCGTYTLAQLKADPLNRVNNAPYLRSQVQSRRYDEWPTTNDSVLPIPPKSCRAGLGIAGDSSPPGGTVLRTDRGVLPQHVGRDVVFDYKTGRMKEVTICQCRLDL